MSTRRRTFLRHSAAAAAAIGLGGSTGRAQPAASAPAAAASPQSTPGGRPQPARHAKDDWLDQLPAVHRLVFDATSPAAAGGAVQYAGTFYAANNDDYGVEAKDLGVVICLRHDATPLAYTDAVWAKYGAILGEALKLTDPTTGQAPVRNMPMRGLTRVSDRGAHFAVCDVATRRFASAIARKVGGAATVDSIHKELIANLIPNSHMVPAGIVAVNRAQERGYALCSCG